MGKRKVGFRQLTANDVRKAVQQLKKINCKPITIDEFFYEMSAVEMLHDQMIKDVAWIKKFEEDINGDK